MPTGAELQREAESHRRRYRDGLVGEWVEFHDRQIGVGFDGTGLFGGRIEFRSDGTGRYEHWGFRGSDEVDFRWRSTGPWQIEIDDGEPCLVNYEFTTDEDFGLVLLRQTPPTGGGDEGGDTFWQSTGPLCLARPP